LRPYQREALDAIHAAEAKGIQRPLLVAPTGAGKTVMFSHAIAERGGRALVLAHREELLAQAANKIHSIIPGHEIGIVKASANQRGADVVVASIQTLARPHRLEALLDNPVNRASPFRTVIVDEAHHATAESYRYVLTGLGCMGPTGHEDLAPPNGPLCVGFTATAGRADDRGLGYVWEEIVYQRGIIQMIAEGYLVDVSAVQVGTDLDLSKVKTRRGDYTEASLGEAIEASNAINEAAAAYVEYAEDRKGLAFTPTVATSLELTAALNQWGIRAEHVDGKTPKEERAAILKRLHTGETQVVSNCMVLTEGFDEPTVSAILNLRPTKSESLFVQMVGRALRKHPDKIDALVVDVAGSSDLGLSTVATLAGLPPTSIKPGESLLEAEERLGADRDDGGNVRVAKTRTVDLFAKSKVRWIHLSDSYVLPIGTDLTFYLVPEGEERWSVFTQAKHIPAERKYSGLSLDYAMGVGEELARADGGSISKANGRWRETPPSEAQRGALARAGYSAILPAVTTKGQAADLLTAHYAGQKLGRLRRIATQ
jgi:superfamily II DNA or RNA helicase